jgi:hypothetical protein
MDSVSDALEYDGQKLNGSAGISMIEWKTKRQFFTDT